MCTLLLTEQKFLRSLWPAHRPIVKSPREQVFAGVVTEYLQMKIVDLYFLKTYFGLIHNSFSL